MDHCMNMDKGYLETFHQITSSVKFHQIISSIHRCEGAHLIVLDNSFVFSIHIGLFCFSSLSLLFWLLQLSCFSCFCNFSVLKSTSIQYLNFLPLNQNIILSEIILILSAIHHHSYYPISDTILYFIKSHIYQFMPQ